MYRCGALLIALALALGLALGSPPKKTVQPNAGPGTDQDQDSDFDMGDICIAGSPSFMCYLRCVQQNLKPSCDQKDQCLCVPMETAPAGDRGDEPQDIPEASQTSSSSPVSVGTETDDDGRLHMIFYIFDMSSLFGGDNETVTTPETATTLPPVPLPGDELHTLEETATLKGWASAHLLAVVIVALLSILVIVELFACLKKQKAKHKEANMFNSLGVPNKS